MNETETKIVAAAVELFSRYGVKRTSMTQVAEQAGTSRQTLYALFNNKDKLLAAAMQAVVTEIFTELDREWQECHSLEDMLGVYFDQAVYRPFEMLKKTPDIKDLIHGIGAATSSVAKQTDAEKTKLLAEQLRLFGRQRDDTGGDPTSVARFIVATTNELKYSVSSRRELEKLLDTLKIAILAMLEK